MGKKLRIGFGLYGALSRDKEGFCKFLMDKFTDNGKQEFFIISGAKDDETIKTELDKLGIFKNIHYKDVFSIPEYLKSQEESFVVNENGNEMFDVKSWNKAKVEICENLNIFLMVDDEEYQKSFEGSKINFMLFDDFIKRVTRSIRK